MQNLLFEYDVFLSFSSDDEESVRSVWQHLTLSGLRVFWSDSSLRDRVGMSWFDVIQESLTRSRHMILVCTPAALRSQWVKREYVAFFNHHYAAPTRLLVPLLASGSRVSDLPLFLRELQAVTLEHPDALKTLVRVLGGVDIADLKAQLAKRDEELALARGECAALRLRLAEATAPRVSVPPLRSEQPETPAPLKTDGGVRNIPAASPPEQSTESPSIAPIRKPDAFEAFVTRLAAAAQMPPAVLILIILVILVLLWALVTGSLNDPRLWDDFFQW